MAIEPYLKYESLLDTLLDLIQNEEKADIRKLAEKCIGKLGALDPNKYKILSKRKHSFMKSYKELAVGKYLAEL